jgi:hypothetical protein
MSIVLMVLDVNGNRTHPAAGCYIVDVDPAANGGRGRVTGSRDIRKARRFEMVSEVLGYVRSHGPALAGYMFEAISVPDARPPVPTGFTFRQMGVGSC